MTTEADGVQPTARPWTADFGATPYEELPHAWQIDAAAGSIATLDGPADINKANAAHIVACVNLHAELVEALEELVSFHVSGPCCERALAVLAKVKP